MPFTPKDNFLRKKELVSSWARALNQKGFDPAVEAAMGEFLRRGIVDEDSSADQIAAVIRFVDVLYTIGEGQALAKKPRVPDLESYGA